MPTHTDQYEPLGDTEETASMQHTELFFELRGKRLQDDFGYPTVFQHSTWGQFIRMLYEAGYDIVLPDGHLLIEGERDNG